MRFSLPIYYYKVVYVPKSGKMIGFVITNEKLTGSTESYAVSVDEVEQQTGIDFYFQLEDSVEE